MPRLEDYTKYLKKIWKNRWLTNDGEFVRRLEKKLAKYWGVKHVICTSNGTSALMLILKAMNIKKLNITPNSFIATASAPAWMGIKLNFVDFGKTFKGPVLVTHVYGIPNVIDAKPVIYDASHAFTTQYNGHSIFQEGTASIISFHAVKIFHTVEGGAVVTNDDKLAEKVKWMRNFGFKTRYSFWGAGINCKMSEFHAAMGLANLPRVKEVRKRYDEIIDKYNFAFSQNLKQCTYYPIWYKTERQLLKAVDVFEKNKIFVRRYFYPALNTVFSKQKCPKMEDIMSRTLCLPLYYDLTDGQIKKIIKIALQTYEISEQNKS